MTTARQRAAQEALRELRADREGRAAREAEILTREPSEKARAMDDYMAQIRAQRTHGHRNLSGMSVQKTMATCEQCGRAKIKFLAEKPEYTHEGRNGRRLAAQYGVKYTPYEDRTEASQEVFGRREQERRDG